jgi:hypothetical protein
MEDLIPLIIVIAISIIGAATRKKKRREGRNISNPGQQTRHDDEIFKWLEKLGIDEDEVSPFHREPAIAENQLQVNAQEAPIEIKTPVRDVLINKYSQFSGFISPEERENLMAREGISSLKPKKEVNDLIQKSNEDALEDLKKQKNVFDLKQAVVFSEILNRKYV